MSNGGRGQTQTVAMIAVVLVTLLAACSAKPLPVPERHMWAPEYGATDFAGASRDAGAGR